MTVPVSDLHRTFARIGWLSFGGPAAQIALMHRELVDRHGWLSEEQFLRALSFCMLLPGPEAMQLATYAGWRLRGVAGGLIAGLWFVGPGALVILALGLGYAYWGDLPFVSAIFFGVKAAVVAIVVEALVKVSRRALVRPAHRVVAGLAFVAMFAFALPFPLVIAAAALWGALTASGAVTPAPLPRAAGTLRISAIMLALWLGPIAVLALADVRFLAEIGAFFSRLAVVTFGGAYAVLAYMTQEVVQSHGWLTTAEMMDGLGLAETTPGPLILVTEFVGFLAGFREAGLPTALAAAAVTLWVTFTPCFLWIFAGAPYIDWIAGRPRLSGALGAITAAVVGVILNLSIWFAAHVFFSEVGELRSGPFLTISPVWTSFDPAAAGLTVLSMGLLLVLRWPLLLVLGLCAGLGFAIHAPTAAF